MVFKTMADIVLSTAKKAHFVFIVIIFGIILPSCVSTMPYVRTLKDGNLEQRRKAAQDIQMLGKRGAPALPALSEAAVDQDPELRRCAIEAIGGLGKKAFDGSWVLIRALRDTDVHVRRAAVISIGNLYQFPTAAFPPLINCLGDKDSLVREFSIATFQGLGSAGVGSLVRALKNENVTIRKSAVIALGRLGPEAYFAITALKQAGQDENIEVSRLACDTVRKLSEEKTGRF
jgi:HEAT repeat protein